MTLQRVWLWGLAIFLGLLLIAAWGCGRVTAIRPFPLPLDQTIAEYMVKQAVLECEESSILVSFVEKDHHRYLLISSEPDVQTGIARWAVVEITEDPTTSYLWEGTATVEGPVLVTAGHSFAIPDHLDLCQLVAKKTTL